MAGLRPARTCRARHAPSVPLLSRVLFLLSAVRKCCKLRMYGVVHLSPLQADRLAIAFMGNGVCSYRNWGVYYAALQLQQPISVYITTALGSSKLVAVPMPWLGM